MGASWLVSRSHETSLMYYEMLSRLHEYLIPSTTATSSFLVYLGSCFHLKPWRKLAEHFAGVSGGSDRLWRPFLRQVRRFAGIKKEGRRIVRRAWSRISTVSTRYVRIEHESQSTGILGGMRNAHACKELLSFWPSDPQI